MDTNRWLIILPHSLFPFFQSIVVCFALPISDLMLLCLTDLAIFFNYCREVSGVKQCFGSARKNRWEIGGRGRNLFCFQPVAMLWR